MALSSPRERILKIAQKMPASAQVLAQLGKLLMDVNSGLDDIAELLKRDASLSARILRVSNSVAYASAERIGSIEEAVNRVGFTEVYRFCGLAAAAQVFDQDLKFYGVSKGLLRTNSLFSALAAEALAKRCGADVQAAYSAGLMRLLGKVVLDALAKETGVVSAPFKDSGESELLSWEGKAFGMTNAAVAALILGEWKFPEGVINPVADQYDPLQSAEVTRSLALTVNLAASLAASSGHGMPGEEPYWLIHPDKLAPLGLNVEILAEVEEEARRSLKKVLEGLG